MAAPSIEPMAREYAERGFEFLFVYVREAHPGEHYPHHTSFDQKLAHARALRDELGVHRPILVDDLSGTAHRRYGRLPNMSYIISSAGRVTFKSDWTDPWLLRQGVETMLRAQELRREGRVALPFYVEQLGYRIRDNDGFQAGLRRAGPKAVDDFARAMAEWRRRGSSPAVRSG